MKHTLAFILSVLTLGTTLALAGELDTLAIKQPRIESRWASGENPTAEKGAGGQENQGAKGHAFDPIRPGETKVLLDVRGSGIINHIWFTVRPTPVMFRSMRLEMVWDDAKTPAVSVPLGDFFGVSHGRTAAFETALFSCPSQRGFNCYVPMPFRKSARVTLKNESSQVLPYFFYTIHYTRQPVDAATSLYFHATWRRENKTVLRRDFEILPLVQGSGRYLGANIGVIANPVYGRAWWGEGEVKMYLDGDRDLPTLVGTGTEDYIGNGWGMSVVNHRYQGCLVADADAITYSFYRFHVPDPIVFQRECRVTMQQIGGGTKKKLLELKAGGVPIEIVTVTVDPHADRREGFIKALERNPPLKLEEAPDEARNINFFRSDDWCATAYFYLDRPENGLPSLADVKERIAGLTAMKNTGKRQDQ